MTREHLIRLRGAWDCSEAAPGSSNPRRVRLPWLWPDDLKGPIQLRRRFQRPPIDNEQEAVLLRLEQVSGLRSARLNGQELLPNRPGPSSMFPDLPITTLLQASNLLELEVDPSAWDQAPPDEPGTSNLWGAIALVIVRGCDYNTAPTSP